MLADKKQTCVQTNESATFLLSFSTVDKLIFTIQNFIEVKTNIVKLSRANTTFFFTARDYLERLLIGAKGSVERTKSHMDKLSTFRTLWPELFSVNNIKSFARYNDTL